MYEVAVTEVVPSRIPGGQAAIVGRFEQGSAVEGAADIVATDGRIARVIVSQILLGLHRVSPSGRVPYLEPGDVAAFIVDTPPDEIAWAVGAKLRSGDTG